MFTKGADSALLPRCSLKYDIYREATIEFANGFAKEGFRTLILCKRVIMESEYQQWLQEYERVNKADVGREQKKNQIYDLIEQNLTIIGCTAIEDKLQEGVGK